MPKVLTIACVLLGDIDLPNYHVIHLKMFWLTRMNRQSLLWESNPTSCWGVFGWSNQKTIITLSGHMTNTLNMPCKHLKKPLCMPRAWTSWWLVSTEEHISIPWIFHIDHHCQVKHISLVNGKNRHMESYTNFERAWRSGWFLSQLLTGVSNFCKSLVLHHFCQCQTLSTWYQ